MSKKFSGHVRAYELAFSQTEQILGGLVWIEEYWSVLRCISPHSEDACISPHSEDTYSLLNYNSNRSTQTKPKL
jgi:hypothetical protein